MHASTEPPSVPAPAAAKQATPSFARAVDTARRREAISTAHFCWSLVRGSARTDAFVERTSAATISAP